MVEINYGQQAAQRHHAPVTPQHALAPRITMNRPYATTTHLDARRSRVRDEVLMPQPDGQVSEMAVLPLLAEPSGSFDRKLPRQYCHDQAQSGDERLESSQ